MHPTKKVLYVITKANWGGAQRYVYDLIAHAEEHGYTPALAYGERGLLAERVEALGVATHEVKSLGRDVSWFKEFSALTELTRLFQELHPEVVHLNSSKAGFIGALAAKRAGIRRIIFTAHGWAFTEPRSKLSRLFFRILQYWTVRLSGKTIAVSDFVAAQANKWDVKNKIVGIHLGIDSLPYLTREEARAVLIQKKSSLAQKTDSLWVGTIAELHRNKGLDIGISGWEKAHPDADWIIIGGGEEQERLTTLAEGNPSIHFLGFMSDAWKYLQAFDLFLLPSRTEALGYVVLEAGAAGVPVIASNAGGTKEALIGSPVGALFESENPASLAEMIQAYLRDIDSLQRTGLALKEYIITHFSLKNMLDETFALYESY